MSDQEPYADVTPADSAKTFAEVFQDTDFIKLAVPTIGEGDTCFDFELPIYDFSSGSRKLTGVTFHLAGVSTSQSVALIFGSYT